MHGDFGSHLGKLADDQLAAAVTRISHIFAVACAGQQDARTSDVSAQVTERVAGELGDMQASRVVDVNRNRADLEDAVSVFKAQEVAIGPLAKAAVFWQAVTADSWSGKDDVAVRWPHLDGFHHLCEIHAISLGKNRPFVQEGKNRGTIGVFDDFSCFRFDGRSITVSGNLSTLITSFRNLTTRVFESEQRVAKEEEPVPSGSREAGPMDPAAVRDLLQQVLREAEKSFPPEKRGWLGLK
jgi:hypothetical protein